MESSRLPRGVTSRPISDPPADWRVYWRSNGQSWRTEPEISASRKRALRLRLDIARERDEYPFKGIEPRLSRADVEWLLAGHNNGRGPVNVYDPEDDGRWGLDLRGADLRGADLRGLPLARMRGGLPESEWRFAEHDQLEAAAVHLEGAHMEHAHLEGAELPGAHCEGAILDEVNLEGANLSQACLDDASLRRARLGGAFLGGARLARAQLDGARLPGAFLVGARLEGAHLANARLDSASLRLTRLEGADARGAHLEGADLSEAHLCGANLADAYLDARTSLRRAVFADAQHDPPALADVSWGGAAVAAADWSQVRRLDDERIARMARMPDGTPKSHRQRLDEHLAAARAYTQVAVELHEGGLVKEAGRLNYRALVAQRGVWLLQRRLPTYVLWWLLFVVTGFGYKPLRAVGWYAAVVALFTAAYVELAHAALGSLLAWKDAALFSVSAFHGLALFTLAQRPAGPLMAAVILEAGLGLLIELTVIASFAYRAR